MPLGHGELGFCGELDVGEPLGDPDVVGVHHARHAFAHRPEVAELPRDPGLGVEAFPAPGIPIRDAKLRVGLEDVVLLDERLLHELPVGW